MSLVRFGQNSLNGLRQRHIDVYKNDWIKKFYIKKGSFSSYFRKKGKSQNFKKGTFYLK